MMDSIGGVGKTTNKSISKKNTFADVAVISLNDYQRIQNTTKTSNVHEEHNNRKILKHQTEQKFATQNNLKDRMKKIDQVKHEEAKKHSNDEIDEQTKRKLLEKSKNEVTMTFDQIMEMDKIVKYSKVSTIRKKQLEQQEMMRKEFTDQNKKMDEMMELERLKELKFHEEQKASKKEQQRLGALVITDQIKDKEIERIRLKEHQEKERLMMLKQIKELADEEKRGHEMKKLQTERMAKEVQFANLKATEIKAQRIYEEKELDLKMIQYDMEKAKKEEDELAEKK